MPSRRDFCAAVAIMAGAAAVKPAPTYATNAVALERFMPDEAEPHQRTWMAFGAAKPIWVFAQVQRDLALIARTIAQFELVTMLVRKQDLAVARKLMGTAVELVVCPLDDLWMRDTGDVKADRAAKETLQKLFPGRSVVQINIDAIAAGGGGIHCTTQQEPA